MPTSLQNNMMFQFTGNLTTAGTTVTISDDIERWLPVAFTDAYIEVKNRTGTKVERMRGTAAAGTLTLSLRGLDQSDTNTEVTALKKERKEGNIAYVTLLAVQIIDRAGNNTFAGTQTFNDIVADDITADDIVADTLALNLGGWATSYASTAARDAALGADGAALHPYQNILAAGAFYNYNTDLGMWQIVSTGTAPAAATTTTLGTVELADQTEVNTGDNTGTVWPVVVQPAELNVFTKAKIAENAWALQNLTIVPSRSSSAETISLKTRAGTDPSATDPIVINFRNATEGTGDYTTITLTAATSITIPSTATMGMTNGVIYRLWLVGINDWGTFKLGVINTQKTTGIHPLKDDVLVSSILIDTASDNAGVIYTAAAATTKAMRVLGYLEYTLAAVGTRDTAPSKIQVYTPSIKLPWDIVQFLYTIPAPTSWTTIMPADGTIPQSGEGVELMTLAITPTSTVNRLLVDAKVNIYANNNGDMGAALFQDAIAGALAAGGAYSIGSTHNTDVSLFYVTLAGTTSSTTFKIRAGLGVAGTIANSWNYSSVQNNYLKVTEMMV